MQYSIKGVQNYIINIISGNSGKTSLKISAKAPKKVIVRFLSVNWQI
jgi:hypothetical protein